jgi:glycosyltransferase involved in cell wall biosynthesis
MKVNLDISPALINKTAVYRLVLDYGDALIERCELSLSVCGKVVASNITPGEFLSSIKDQRKSGLVKDVNDYFTNKYSMNAEGAKDVCVNIYLDPAYIPKSRKLISSDYIVIHDLTTYTNPHWHSQFVRQRYKRAFYDIAKSECNIISDSESTSSELYYHFCISKKRIRTLPLYLVRSFNQKEFNNPTEKTMLFVGNLEARKNLKGLLKGFQISELNRLGYILEIVGMNGHGSCEILDYGKKIDGINFNGFVSEKKLKNMYLHCFGFCYPSFWEGFGMPLLEAMSYGCVCLSTLTGASPEIGGDAVIYCDPYKPESIAAGLLTMHELSNEQRSFLSNRAFKRSQNFTAKKYFEKLFSILGI